MGRGTELTQLFNAREALFDENVTSYAMLKEMAASFAPFHEFWSLAANWVVWTQAWMHGPFKALDPDEVERNAEHAKRTMLKVRLTACVWVMAWVCHFLESRPRQQQDWFLKCLQGRRAHPLAV